MSIALALVAALGLGTGDFLAGLASRRLDFRAVSAFSQSLALVAALLAVLVSSGDGLSGRVLLWGAVAGVGNGFGAIALYHGLSIGRMSVVATLSGLVGAVIPVCAGLIQGDSLSTLSAVGIVIAIPAIALVSWQPAAEEERASGASGGAVWGLIAGLGFALFYVAFDHAGDRSGAWPIAISEAVSVLIAALLAVPALASQGLRWRRPDLALVLYAGVSLGLAVLALQAAFATGELAIVVVLTSLYPGVTTLFARFALAEHWIRTQRIGLVAALAAVVLVSAGAG